MNKALLMRPAVFITILFASLAVFVTALAAGLGWMLAGLDPAEGLQSLYLFGSGAVVLVLFALICAWAVIALRLVRPLDSLTREIETLNHASQMRRIDTPANSILGDLPLALNDLVAKAIATRDDRQQAIDEALDEGEAYKRRLETILLDLSEGVIVCNLDNRVLLYNQSAAEILGQPEALGLGRRLFGLLEREPVIEALRDLTALQRGDKTQKLRTSRRIKCERRDGGEEFDMSMALVCSDEVETEGYVLTFSGAATDDEALNALPPRPEFYDFDLFRRDPDRKGRDIPLKELRCVAFDTETTGLQPSSGDEIISIGAVRVTNGRIVTSETFERLINPGMKIPQPSIRFHGITDKDVKGKPEASVILPQFHRFCGSAVLIAHNAAFDMKFLELKEKTTGVKFANPVVDILLLSAFLHDHAEDHSMNATAKRFGIKISGRHTALGDAIVTARIYLAMLDPLADRGVLTLGDALEVSQKQVKIRKMQAQF